MYELIKQKLIAFPNFRERSRRGEYLATLALRHLGLEQSFKEGNRFTTKQLSDIAVAYESLNRAWRKVLEENKDLRGKDYEEKIELVQAKQLELGYSPQNLAFLKHMDKLVKDFDETN